MGCGAFDAGVVGLAGMLDADDDALLVHDGAAGFGADGNGEELFCLTAIFAFKDDAEQSVVGLECIAVSGDPQVSVWVEGKVVRARDGADLALVEAAEVGVGCGRISAHEKKIPAEGSAGVVVGDFEDLAVLVVVARVRLVGRCAAVDAALGVVGQGDVYLAALRVCLEVFGATIFVAPTLSPA